MLPGVGSTPGSLRAVDLHVARGLLPPAVFVLLGLLLLDFDSWGPRRVTDCLSPPPALAGWPLSAVRACSIGVVGLPLLRAALFFLFFLLVKVRLPLGSPPARLVGLGFFPRPWWVLYLGFPLFKPRGGLHSTRHVSIVCGVNNIAKHSLCICSDPFYLSTGALAARPSVHIASENDHGAIVPIL